VPAIAAPPRQLGLALLILALNAAVIFEMLA
jgi:hypothetical protein